MVKIALAITIVLSSILVYNLLPNYSENLFENFSYRGIKLLKKPTNLSYSHFKVDDVVEDFIWRVDGDIQYVKNGEIIRFNTKQRISKVLYKRSSETTKVTLNISNSDSICLKENFIRRTPEDFGTRITIHNILNNNVKVFNLKQTVKVDICDDNLLHLSEAYPFMQKQRFLLNTESGEITINESISTEIDSPNSRYKLEKERNIRKIVDSHRRTIFTVKPLTEIVIFKVSLNESSLAYKDISNNLWVYTINE